MKFYEKLMSILDEEWENIKIMFAEPWEISWEVAADIRDDYEIYFLEKGKGRFVINETEYPVAKGDVMFIHTKSANSFVADEVPVRFVFVTFKIDRPKSSDNIAELNRLIESENYPLRINDPQTLQEVFYKIQKEFCLKSPGYMFKIKLLLGEMVSALSEQQLQHENRSFISNKNAHEIINYLIIYIQNNYSRSITLEELGTLANLHPRYLCTLFRQVCGKTISELIREIRIEKAKRLLLYTSLSVTEIAMEVGFADCQYFSRVFRRSENISPRAYRKSFVVKSEYNPHIS